MRSVWKDLMHRILPQPILFLVPVFFLAAAPAHAAEPPSGLPLPRYASLRSAEVNVRAGPGTRYPIQWIYRRDGLPVEIVEEFDLWRKIRDSEGSSGWVHRTMLEGRRTVLVKGKEPQIARADPEDDARKVFRVSPQAMGRVRKCVKDWCQLEVAGHSGWLRKKFLWGVKAEEEWR